MMAGTFVIFKAGIKDNKGTVVVPADQKQTDPVLESMGYLVEGVIGSTAREREVARRESIVAMGGSGRDLGIELAALLVATISFGIFLMAVGASRSRCSATCTRARSGPRLRRRTRSRAPPADADRAVHGIGRAARHGRDR